MTSPASNTPLMRLEELAGSGEIQAALIFDPELKLTARELELVREAFTKGLELGKKITVEVRSGA